MSSAMDRRDFLGRAAGGGAAAAAGLAMTQTLRAAARPGDTVVLGVMGLNRGKALARGLARLPGVRIQYVCDADRDRAESGAEAVQQIAGAAPQAIQDFRRILDDKTVDALVCAAPNHWHAPATILGCAAGKHVYVEKPCCHNPREGELMVQAARKYRRVVQMGSQRRSGPGTREAIQRLREGAIGRVYLARCWYNSSRGSIGTGKPAPVPPQLDYDLWQGPAPRRPYLDNRIHYNWHWFWHWGNGELGNNGVHPLDLCRWGLNVDFPIQAASGGGRYCYEDDQETPDTHAVCFEFEGRRMISWEGLSCNRHNRSGFVVFYGKEGALELDGGGDYRIYDLQERLVKEQKSPSDGMSEHLANFVEAIRNEKPMELNAEIEKGYKSTLLCHLGNIAHRTGRTLHCSPTDGKIQNDSDAMQYWSRQYEPGWAPKV